MVCLGAPPSAYSECVYRDVMGLCNCSLEGWLSLTLALNNSSNKTLGVGL